MKRHHLMASAVVFALFGGRLGCEEARSQSVDKKGGDAQTSQPDGSQRLPSVGVEPPFTADIVAHLTVHDDKTATEITTKRIKILSQGAVQVLSQQSTPFVEGMQTIETLEAFTEKADGRHISIDPTNIITRDAASGLQATYAADAKVRTFIFPDVAVGDTLVTTLKSDTSRDFFAGEFMDFDLFPRSLSVASVLYTVEAPVGLDLAVRVVGRGASDETEIVGGIRRHILKVAGDAYRPEEPGAVSPFDRDPSVSISTFHSYVDLGRAYGRVALPQARLTPEVEALADSITRGIKGRREQAAAIDAWVKKNIRYVAVHFSVGRVVPHDAATVLRNKFGDCKDKVTLMSTLLAAKGIVSEAVLINLGSAYALPEPPTLAVLNHAIVYIPEFDLYDDPTANAAAFGILAPEAYDKPVIRVSATGASLARTPTMNPEVHATQVKTRIQFAANGMVSGQTEERSTGAPAGGLRAAGNLVQQVGREIAAQRQLQSFNTPGTGHFDLENSAALLDPIVLKSDFALNDRFKAPAPAGVAAIPVGLRLSVRPGTGLLGARLSGRQSAFACLGGSQSEDIDAIFDAALPMPTPLPAMSIDNPFFTYRSTYKIENRTLKIHREFVSRVARQVCPAAMEAQITPDMNRVFADVHSAYRFNVPAPTSTVAEFSNDVVAGERKRVSFIYDLNRDCSLVGFAKVTTTDPPKQGRISVDRAAGFPSLPQNNPRSVCNKTQVEGMEISYESNKGFTGEDKFAVDIVFLDGFVSKRRYTIRVGASAKAATVAMVPTDQMAAAPVDKPPQRSAPVPVLEVRRIMVRDQKLRVAAFFEVNPDCSVVGVPTVRILSPSKNGKVALENGTGFTGFPATNPRAKCNAKSTNGAVISYTPEPGYVGADSVTAEIVYLDGTSDTFRYAIDVK